jgi:hypothetical protein
MVTKSDVKGFQPHPNSDIRLNGVYRQ